MVCLYKEMEGHLQIIPSRNPKEELLQCKKAKRTRVGMGQESEWFLSFNSIITYCIERVGEAFFWESVFGWYRHVL